jgi:hypothetical protein
MLRNLSPLLHICLQKEGTVASGTLALWYTACERK